MKKSDTGTVFFTRAKVLDFDLGQTLAHLGPSRSRKTARLTSGRESMTKITPLPAMRFLPMSDGMGSQEVSIRCLC